MKLPVAKRETETVAEATFASGRSVKISNTRIFEDDQLRVCEVCVFTGEDESEAFPYNPNSISSEVSAIEKAYKVSHRYMQVEDIAEAFTKARQAVAAIRGQYGDTGTCNMDSVYVTIPRGWHAKYKKAFARAGVDFTESYGRGSKKYFVHGLGVGTVQGLQQTKEAEKAASVLSQYGLQGSVHYAID